MRRRSAVHEGLSRPGEALDRQRADRRIQRRLEVRRSRRRLPIGHKRRRADGIPLLVEKFRTNLARRFPVKQQQAIHDVSLDQARLEAMPVNEYVDLYVISPENVATHFLENPRKIPWPTTSTKRSRIRQRFRQRQVYSLPQLGKALNVKIERLPVSIRIVLESVLRNYDGKKIAEEHIEQLANWKPTAPRVDEIPFVVSRVVLQDFTGVPLLADIAAMRGVAQRAGKNPEIDRAARAGRSGCRPLGADRSLPRKERARSEHEAGIPAQQRALPVHEMGHAGVRHVQGRSAGRRHRPPGEPRVPRARRAQEG